MFKKQSAARAALYGATMSEIRYLLDGKLAVISTTKKMIADHGAVPSDTEGFVDFPLSVDGVEVAVSILEVKPRQYKLSLRSKGKTDVNAIASVFGGGGHILASGCMMFGELEEVIDKLRYTVSQYLA
jgi:phosphoesterase RecJ-like protein